MSDAWESAAGRMVDELGPLPREIAAALRAVPRHEFVPVEARDHAYDDAPVPLGSMMATISAPHMVALQLEAAELAPGDRLLELGSGSGYLLAVASRLIGPSGTLAGIELEPELAARSRVALEALGLRVDVRVGDASRLPEGLGEFDAIVVSFAVRDFVLDWTAALAEGGRLVAPLGDGFAQVLTTYRRRGKSGTMVRGPLCRFVPLRPHI